MVHLEPYPVTHKKDLMMKTNANRSKGETEIYLIQTTILGAWAIKFYKGDLSQCYEQIPNEGTINVLKNR